VTDANLMLGYLDPANFLGGRRPLDKEASEKAVVGLGRQLGLDTISTAAGIHRVINARMADGLRVATVRRGVDPRRFTLLAFGGAAGLHIAAIAAALGITRVLLPLRAAVLSAWGMLNTELRVELMRSLAQDGIDIAALQAACATMEQEGRDRLRWFAGETTVRRSADMRYGEQISEIAVPVSAFDQEILTEAFHDAHEALFTYALRDRLPVLVNARVTVAGSMPTRAAPVAAQPSAPPGHRRVHLGTWQEVRVYRFGAMAPGQEVTGPAIIESDTTTVLLRDGDTARFHAGGWLEMDVTPG
jgi:N-methylhydantoinase A